MAEERGFSLKPAVVGSRQAHHSSNVRDWLARRVQTLGLLPEYLHAVLQRWNDILWLSLPAFPFVIWWFLGSPPVWLVALVLVWLLAVAGYYAWRDEHLKLLGPHFKSWISGTAMLGNSVFIGIRITNIGPPTSIHGWQAGHKLPDGRRMFYVETVLLADANLVPPRGIGGTNLRGDYRIFATGETREGWIAFDVGPISGEQTALEATARILETVSAQFFDAFDRQHEVQSISTWAGNPRPR